MAISRIALLAVVLAAFVSAVTALWDGGAINGGIGVGGNGYYPGGYNGYRPRVYGYGGVVGPTYGYVGVPPEYGGYAVPDYGGYPVG